ncbi:MAG: hypothetical protein ACYSOG_08035 [Planctomycetota bacterium]|jgi:DNA replication protein DnaD
MNTSYGWIKLHRNLLRHPLWEVSTPEQKVLLVALLMMANHAEKKWEWNGRPYYCRPGQMITSLKSLSEKCGKGVTRRKVQTALRFFENCGFLVKQASRHNTLITICNWEAYQAVPDTDVTDSDKPVYNDGQTSVTPMLSNKKKRRKNEKNTKKYSLPYYLDSEDEDLEGYSPQEIKDLGLAERLVMPQ